MKELFVCNTPFQLFNALNLVWNKKDEKGRRILYFIDECKTAPLLVSRVQESKLFDEVHFIKPYGRKYMEKGLTRTFYSLLDYFRPRKLIQRVDGKDIPKEDLKGFDRCYSSFMGREVCSLLALNRNSEYILFEDGTGSYSGSIVPKGSRLGHLFYSIFKVGYCANTPTALYINNLTLCKSTSVPKNCIRSLPPFTPEFIEFADRIFSIEKNSYRDKKIIYLSQPVQGRVNAAKQRDTLIKALYPFRNDIIVRLHPRDNDLDAYAGFTVDKGLDFWELKLVTEQIEDKILLADYSGAQTMPKMLFNKEPICVFTYKMHLEEEKKDTAHIALIEELKSNYKDPSRLMEIRSAEELQSYLISQGAKVNE